MLEGPKVVVSGPSNHKQLLVVADFYQHLATLIQFANAAA